MSVAPLVAIEDLPGRLGPEARLLGLDLGTKTIGMALSDVTRSVATPYRTLQRTKFTNDAEAIEQAKSLAIGHGVELWQLDRKVAVFLDQNKTP